MSLYRLSTLLIEGRYPILLDIAFTGETKFLFDCDLDGQSVAIPSRFAPDIASLHSVKAREYVFEDTSFDVMSTGHAVGGRRSLEEGPWFA
jgi:hypothetical protein